MKKRLLILLLVSVLSITCLNGCTFLLLDLLTMEDETTTEESAEIETTTETPEETTTVHKHNWQKKCGETSVCVDCGKDDGKIVEHTTDLGICENCGQEFRKQSPVTIIGRTWEKDTSSYWQNSVKFYNHSYKSSIITQISIEYMDGTIEEVGKYHDNIVE